MSLLVVVAAAAGSGITIGVYLLALYFVGTNLP